MTLKNMNLIGKVLMAAAFAVLGASQLTYAQSFPSKTIVVVRPTAPGGTDVPLRILLQKVSDNVKQGVVLDSKPGAAGTIASMFVKQAPADGYTLLMGHPGNLAINQSLFSSLPYDPVKDFEPIILLWTYPLIMLVPADRPARNVRELIEYGRSKPGGLNFGSPATGTTPHLIGEMLKLQTGVPMEHIAYKGAAPALVDLVAGRLDFYFTSYLAAAAFVKQGRLRILAVTSASRSPFTPDVPTIQEAGFTGLDIGNWQGLLAPAGTPKAVISRLHKEFASALESEEVKRRFEKEGFETNPLSTPADLAALIKTDIERFGKAVKASGARAD